jgi:hypothetical protein
MQMILVAAVPNRCAEREIVDLQLPFVLDENRYFLILL